MEFNARKQLDTFIEEKEEEYKEIIYYIGYSMFEYLSEAITKRKENIFKMGYSHACFGFTVNSIIKKLEEQTKESKSKMVFPDTIAEGYYKNEQLIERFGCLTNYILYLSNEAPISEKTLPYSDKLFIINMVIKKYQDKPIFMELLTKKLEQEFYIKSLEKQDYKEGFFIPTKCFFIDFDRYFDSIKSNEENKQIKVKHL